MGRFESGPGWVRKAVRVDAAATTSFGYPCRGCGRAVTAERAVALAPVVTMDKRGMMMWAVVCGDEACVLSVAQEIVELCESCGVEGVVEMGIMEPPPGGWQYPGDKASP